MRTCSQMPYHTGIVVRIYPNYRQKRIISVNDGCSRFVYNRLVALSNERYTLSKTAAHVPAEAERLSYINSILSGEASLPAAIKNSAPFLYGEDVDSQSVTNAIRNYQTAWKNYRERPSAGIPKFHKKSSEQRYQTNAHYYKGAGDINGGNVRIEDAHHAVLPILGRIRIAGSCKRLNAVMGRQDTRIGTITISRDAIGRYFASFQMASETPFCEPLPDTGSMVGIDVNIENFLWDSDNNMVDNPRYKRDISKQLAKVQKSMSRKRERAKKEERSLKDSRNYQKDRIRAAYLQAKAAGRGNDFRHVISKGYVKNHDYIFAEDIRTKSLLKNHRLAFAISECGWGDFLNKLEYKAGMYGKTFLKVNASLTTQTCSVCGSVLPKDRRLTLLDRNWICPVCGEHHIRDYNAAKVILARGMASLGM